MDSATLQRIHNALYATYGAGAVLPFTQLSPWLKALGVDYKALGFEKLRDFVQTWSTFATIELQTPRPGNPPVAYLALRAAGAEPDMAAQSPQGLPADVQPTPAPLGATAPAGENAASPDAVCPDVQPPVSQPHLATKEGNARRRSAAMQAFQSTPAGSLASEGPLTPGSSSALESPSPVAAAPASSQSAPDGNLLDTLQSALLADYGPGQSVPFAALGSWLRRQGVDYKALGHNKLREFVQTWSPFAVVHDHYLRPDSPPVAYLLIRNADGSLPAFSRTDAEEAQAASTSATDRPATSMPATDRPTAAFPATPTPATDRPAAASPATPTPSTGGPGSAGGVTPGEDPAASRPAPDAGLLDALRQALYASHSPGEDIPFTSLSPWLLKQGVDYKALGYHKLRDFVQTWSGFADILTRTPREGRPPVAYLVLRGPGGSAAPAPGTAQDASTAQTTSTAPAQEPGAPQAASPSQAASTGRRLVIRPGQKNNILPGRELEAWAYMGYWPETLRALADLALPEKWSFGGGAEDSRPILRSYLCNTFFRLKMEEKILYSADGKWAAWNTGLVSGSYDEIFAVFGHNASRLSEWALGGFCIAGGRGLGKTLVANFSPLPSRASYFEHLQDLLYDVALPYYVDYRHIIVDNIRRLPVDFLRTQCYDQPTCAGSLAALAENASARNPAWEALKETVEDTQMLYNRLRNRVQEAVELAIKRVSWNYKTAIPMFYPRFRSMSLMLPLCLGNDASIDAALVMDRTRAGNYQGQTILTLDQAYLDARLICRPDSEWLNPDVIDQAAYEED